MRHGIQAISVRVIGFIVEYLQDAGASLTLSAWQTKSDTCANSVDPDEKAYFITKTYLYNFDPLKPHFYIVKLRFTGVYIIFLISAQKHRLWVLVRTASLRQF